MSNRTFKTLSLLAIAIAAVLPLLTAPAFAEKNNGAYSGTLGKMVKAHDAFCDNVMLDYIDAEREAGARAGTKAAEPYAKAADAAWDKGASNGCSWARQ